MATDAATDPNCVFCKIVAGEVPAEVVHRTETTLAFRDLQPQAPTHVLVIPTSHHPDAVSLVAAEPQVAVDLFNSVAVVAEKEGLGEGYRLVFNTGALAHQTVFHAHLHVLGGRRMTWPPG
ncbi:MAG TPA: histidine triad nucleotide-binding protein [Nocardioidaceae bacterium]|jgi:histidine triad (HIT) family protein|nr:histidine triad nucleotide-binding protein [Nocardioidaceae bacterium]